MEINKINKKKTPLVIFIYILYHLIIEGFIIFLASISPLAEMFEDTEWIRYFAVIIAFIALLLDNYFYSSIVKKIDVNILHKKIIFVIDILIFAIALIYFVMINAVYILAESSSLSEVTHWVWIVTFVALMFAFVYFSKAKNFKKSSR